MIRVATAFSGGLAAPEFALKYSGIEHEIVFACEWDKYARKQYLQFHGKPTAFYEDIKNLCAKCYYALIDLFIFGSPCQNLSLAGNQKGLEGEKSKYFFEGYRVLSEMMPKVFIFENVKGLLSSNKGKDFALVMKMFRELGYHCAHTVLNTKDYGVPQNRERVFVVGFLDVNSYHDFNFLPGFPLKKRLIDVLESDVDEKYYLSDKLIKTFLEKSNDPKSKMTIQAFHNKDDAYSACLTAQYQKSRITDPYIKEPIIKIKSATKNGYEIAHAGDSINYKNTNSKTRRGRIGKQISQTIETNCQIGVFDGNFIRKFTPRECFRLFGVRDKDINIVVSDAQAYKIAGNAISVPPLEMIITQIFRPQRIASLFSA